MIENLRLKLRKSSTNKATRITQTAPTLISKRRLAPAGKRLTGASFEVEGSSDAGSLKPLLPGRDVAADPLQGDSLQRAVIGHHLEDRLDLRLPFRVALVGGHPDRLGEQRLSDVLQLAVRLLDTRLGGEIAVDHRIKALARAETEVLEGSVLGIVGHHRQLAERIVHLHGGGRR